MNFFIFKSANSIFVMSSINRGINKFSFMACMMSWWNTCLWGWCKFYFMNRWTKFILFAFSNHITVNLRVLTGYFVINSSYWTKSIRHYLIGVNCRQNSYFYIIYYLNEYIRGEIIHNLCNKHIPIMYYNHLIYDGHYSDIAMRKKFQLKTTIV